MIACLQFIKTQNVESNIKNALQSIPINTTTTKDINSREKLQKMQQAPFITLEDAEFIINLFSPNTSHHHHQKTNKPIKHRLNKDDSNNDKHYVHELLKGCSIYKPPPKISKNPQFEQYLQKLRAKQAQKDYNKLINSNKPSDHEKSLLSTIRDERGVQQWLEMTSIGHLIMIMVGSFLIFYYLAHHLYPNEPNYKIVGGAIGLLLGLIVEFGLMVVREERAELESKAKSDAVNLKKHHAKYNKKSIQSILDAQKERQKLITQKLKNSQSKKDK